LARTLSRQEQIVALLSTLHEARESLGINQGGDGDGHPSRQLTMPADYHRGSYAELERAMARMRAERPRPHWHVRERYVDCRRRTLWLCSWCGNPLPTARKPGELVASPKPHKHGSRLAPELWAVIEEWDEQVSIEQVRRGLDWLDQELGSLWLPRELYEVLAA
jgi:hypothetical protein